MKRREARGVAGIEELLMSLCVRLCHLPVTPASSAAAEFSSSRQLMLTSSGQVQTASPAANLGQTSDMGHRVACAGYLPTDFEDCGHETEVEHGQQ